MIAQDSRFRLNDEYVWEPMPDGCILYCKASGQIVTVNPVTELILSYCDGATTLQGVLESVREDVELAEPDFNEVVDKLVIERVLLPA